MKLGVIHFNSKHSRSYFLKITKEREHTAIMKGHFCIPQFLRSDACGFRIQSGDAGLRRVQFQIVLR